MALDPGLEQHTCKQQLRQGTNMPCCHTPSVLGCMGRVMRPRLCAQLHAGWNQLLHVHGGA